MLLLFLLCMTTGWHFPSAAFKIKEQPANATVYIGQNHTLICRFTEIVPRCTWSHEGILVEIKNRYQFVSNGGKNTDECSFNIIRFNKTDANTWQCLASDGIKPKPVSSDIIFLMGNGIPNSVIILYNGKSITELKLQNDTQMMNLTCIVENAKSNATNMYWRLDGSSDINGNISYYRWDDQNWTSTLAWHNKTLPIKKSTSLSCIVQDGNATLESSITIQPTDGNASEDLVIAVVGGSNSTEMIFYGLLAAASAVLLLIIVVGLVAMLSGRCCSESAKADFFKSTRELPMPCDSVWRIASDPEPEITVRNALYNGSCASQQNLERGQTDCKSENLSGCGYITNIDMPSYMQLQAKEESMQFVHNDDNMQVVDNLNFWSCGCPIPIPCQCSQNIPNLGRNQIHKGSCPAMHASMMEDLYDDGQSLRDPAELSMRSRNINNFNAPGLRHSFACPAYSKSEESLYNDCVPTQYIRRKDNSISTN